MDAAAWVVTLAGAALLVVVNAYFLGGRRR
jgi:hypothetical protein